MVHHQLNEIFAIPALEKLDHPGVLIERPLKQGGVGDRMEADGMGARGEGVDLIGKIGIPAGGEQFAMKRQIGAEHRPRVVRLGGLAVLRVERIELFEHLGRRGQRHDLRGMPLEKFAHVVDLADFLGRKIADRSAAVRLPDDDAHRLELRQRGPDHVALGGVYLRQFLLEQAFAWLQAAEHDLLLEAFDDMLERRSRVALSCALRWFLHVLFPLPPAAAIKHAFPAPYILNSSPQQYCRCFRPASAPTVHRHQKIRNIIGNYFVDKNATQQDDNRNGVNSMYEAPTLIIDGKGREGCSGDRETIVNPATEEVLGVIELAGPGDVADAVLSARRGFAAWRQVNSWTRSDVLRRIGALIRERKSLIARLITLEVGKPLVEAELETISAAEHFEWAADAARQLGGFLVGTRTPSSRGKAYYEPVGVALALTAWNFPVNLSARKISMALAAGCSVIVRPAHEAPGSVAALVRCCIDAGLPDGAITLLFGTPEDVIKPLMDEPAVRKVSFTGSTRVGKILIAQSAGTVKRLTMELGGHAPVIVLPDADVARAAETAALAKFRNAGQVCVSPSRFYVHRSIADDFVARFVDVARGMKLGNGLDPSVTLGPMTTARQRDRAEALVADARARGATVAHGGMRPEGVNAGFFFEPTVMTDLDPASDLLHEEPFAPIAPIMAFDDVSEAVEQANGLEAGLAAYVFTRSLGEADRISESLETGMVGVNTCAVALPEGPFGGVKQSGYGREGGPTAIYDYLNLKFTHSQFI